MSFTQTFKRELATIPRILYARSRDFSRPNANFVDQSGTFQLKNCDFPAGAGEEGTKWLNALYVEAFQDAGNVTAEQIKLLSLPW